MHDLDLLGPEMSGAQLPDARVLMPTTRGFTNKAFQAAFYEAQDVLCDLDSVDMMCLQPRSGFRVQAAWQRRLLYRDITKRLVFANPGLRRAKVTKYYDMFLVPCQNYRDLLYINAIDGWKDHCRVKVCVIEEIYAASIPSYRHWLHFLQQFDHVFIGACGTVEALSRELGQRCHWLPPGVDALRFTPQPDWPARHVDVYSVGRRWDGLHRALLGQVKERGIFYLHDTFVGSDADLFDHRQHRDLYANIAKRSRYFMVAPGKMDDPRETGGQLEPGYRYYEGAAAGAVLVGQVPDARPFQAMFGWADAVIKLKPDGSDVSDVLRGLESDPEQWCRIAKRNAVQSLLQHDWVYRWKQLFEVAGVSAPPGAASRVGRLAELAHLVGGQS